MDEDNPYTPPQVSLYKKLFPEMDFKTLNRLRNRSHYLKVFSFVLGGIATMGAMMAFGALIEFILVGNPTAAIPTLFLSFFLFGIFALAAYGASARPPWGQTFGLLISFGYLCLLVLWFVAEIAKGNGFVFYIFLLLVPIGLVGLFAFSEESLFGDQKYLHQDLKEEYEYRKREQHDLRKQERSYEP